MLKNDSAKIPTTSSAIVIATMSLPVFESNSPAFIKSKNNAALLVDTITVPIAIAIMKLLKNNMPTRKLRKKDMIPPVAARKLALYANTFISSNFTSKPALKRRKIIPNMRKPLRKSPIIIHPSIGPRIIPDIISPTSDATPKRSAISPSTFAKSSIRPIASKICSISKL